MLEKPDGYSGTSEEALGRKRENDGEKDASVAPSVMPENGGEGRARNGAQAGGCGRRGGV